MLVRFPMALFLERFRHFLGHVVFVVLCQDVVSLERARSIERALGHDPLPFAEQIRQQTLIGDRYRVLAVGDDKIDLQVLAAHDAALFDQATEPDAGAWRYMLLDDVRRRIEKHDRVPKRAENERHRDTKDGERGTDQSESSLFA